MNRAIKKAVYTGVVLTCLVLLLSACSKKESLQQYYVSHAEKEGFINVELPAGMIDVSDMELTPEQKEAYKSIDKMNILALRVTPENHAVFQTEEEKVSNILTDDSFQELFRLSDGDKKGVLKYLGEENHIDEVVFFGSDDNKGFILVRILGKDMSAESMMEFVKLLEKADIDEGQLGGLKELMR